MLPDGLKTDEEDYGGRRGYAGAAPRAGGVGAVAGVGAALAGPGRPKLVGTVGGGEAEEVDQPSACESVGGDATTHVGSFCLPGSASLAGGPAAGAAAAGGADSRASGGDDDDDDDGVDGLSEAGVTSVTAVSASALAREGWGSAGEAVAASEWRTGGRGGGGRWLLDAYREPEGNDWGELEDWQGLPGLQLAGGGGGGAAAARLQVTLTCRNLFFDTWRRGRGPRG